ncbi:MAG: glycosyltransferase [Phycisphaera sp.]|nr:glycosyltransferase [Phycisphaera sp.]
MRVLFDGTVFNNAHQRGIQRIFFELLKRLPATLDATIRLEQGHGQELPPTLNRFFTTKQSHQTRRQSLAAKLAYPRYHRLLRHHDIFVPTYFTFPRRVRLPIVMTVYDMIPERFPEMCKPWGSYEVGLKARAIARADRFIAISQSTADDLVEFHPHTRGRITVVHPGADHLPLRNEPPDDTDTRDPNYLLYVGRRNGYKNFQIIIHAMTLPDWPGHVKVLAVGGGPFSAQEAELVQRYALTDRLVHAGQVSDQRLDQLYTDALGAVTTSRLEGFGFPMVEAQGRCVPVLCTDGPMFREVVGDAGLFFDPDEPASLAKAVRELLDPGKRSQLRRAGLLNTQRFKWDAAADATWHVFENTLAECKR